MNQGAWIRVHERVAGKAEQPTRENIRGVSVAVQISPYDQPQAFRGFYIPERGVFRIEFKYLDEELGELQPADKMVSLELGKYSRKLLAIEVAVDQHNVKVVELQLVNNVLQLADETVKDLQTRASRPNARLNYRAVDEVLQQGKANPGALVSA